MARKRSEKSGKSPYQRYGKVPFRYSDIYQRWREAVMRGRDREAAALAAEHARRFSPASDTRSTYLRSA